LKPENVGFDIRGDVKLFDFGLSCEFPKDKEGPYKLTGTTGSLLYMAPENYLCQMYDETVDIYSLGIIFWEILSLNPLYPNFNASMLKDMVINRGVRPTMNNKWNPGLQDLLKNMWSKDATVRPTARQVNILMIRELSNVQKNETSESGMQMMRRRSTFVQRRHVSKKILINNPISTSI
jgi:serine/threonine protein kinase